MPCHSTASTETNKCSCSSQGTGQNCQYCDGDSDIVNFHIHSANNEVVERYHSLAMLNEVSPSIHSKVHDGIIDMPATLPQKAIDRVLTFISTKALHGEHCEIAPSNTMADNIAVYQVAVFLNITLVQKALVRYLLSDIDKGRFGYNEMEAITETFKPGDEVFEHLAATLEKLRRTVGLNNSERVFLSTHPELRHCVQAFTLALVGNVSGTTLNSTASHAESEDLEKDLEKEKRLDSLDEEREDVQIKAQDSQDKCHVI